jgi:hypothetical protein
MVVEHELAGAAVTRKDALSDTSRNRSAGAMSFRVRLGHPAGNNRR